MGFFGFIASILAMVSLILIIPIFIDYFKTGLVLRFPTLIVSCFIMLTSILSLICGIILQVIVKKERQRYELYLNEISKSRN